MKRAVKIRSGLYLPADLAGNTYLLSALTKQSDQRLVMPWVVDYLPPVPIGGYILSLDKKRVPQGKLTFSWTFRLMSPLMFKHFCTQYAADSEVTVLTYDKYQQDMYVQAIIQHPDVTEMLPTVYPNLTFTFVDGVDVTV